MSDLKLKQILVKIIKRFWFGYKVCEGCDSLVYEDVGLCPICRAYRYDDSKTRVHETADKILTDESFIIPQEYIEIASKAYNDLNSEKEK